jgi:TPP-dependent indolepyruvate ferredoxin oxidoreductase alpha subunit
LRKNLTLDEKKVLVRKQRARKMEENKETVFRMNGDVVPLDRLMRHEKRQKEEEEEGQNAFGAASPTGELNKPPIYLDSFSD